MKSSFLIGVLFGLFAATSAAWFYPWADQARATSLTTVAHNGGRLEDFVIRYPVDRIASAGTSEMGLRAKPFPDGAGLPDEMASGVLVEHFKLRDIAGNVIGIAARHASLADDAGASAWALTIPRRGTMRLIGAASPGALDRELSAAGRIDGRAWSGDIAMTVGDEDGASGQVAGGSEEFDGLVGSYTEQWEISGVTESGELRGTINLRTTSEFPR